MRSLVPCRPPGQLAGWPMQCHAVPRLPAVLTCCVLRHSRFPRPRPPCLAAEIWRAGTCGLECGRRFCPGLQHGATHHLPWRQAGPEAASRCAAPTRRRGREGAGLAARGGMGNAQPQAPGRQPQGVAARTLRNAANSRHFAVPPHPAPTLLPPHPAPIPARTTPLTHHPAAHLTWAPPAPHAHIRPRPVPQCPSPLASSS